MSNEFKEKLKTIQFGKGTKKYPKNYYDSDALREQGLTGDRDEVLSLTDGVGYLKWSRGVPYKRNWKTGEVEKASANDMEKLLGPEKEGRFDPSTGRVECE